MTTKKKPRRRVPDLPQERDAARFWSSHDMTDFTGDLKDLDEALALDPRLAARIRERMRKRLVSIRLEEWQIERAKALAKTKGVPYQRLLRDWIARGIRGETRPDKRRKTQ